MKYLALLGGEHPGLALAELRGVLAAFGLSGEQVQAHGRVASFQTPAEPVSQLAGRLGLSRSVLAEWGRASLSRENWPSPEELSRLVAASGRLPAGSFQVRVTRTGAAPEGAPLAGYERSVGGTLKSAERPVDLSAPEHTLRILMDRDLWWGLEGPPTAYVRVQGHHVKHRPHFAPISLDPRTARAMVNLAGLSPGQTILDPFCGTGGLLIEAGSLGYRLVGTDIQGSMVNGTRANLEHFGIPVRQLWTRTCDVGNLQDHRESIRGSNQQLAIVTDPPYGRSATTANEAVVDLMERAWKAFANLLHPGERVVLAQPTSELLKLAAGDFILDQTFDQRVHRSLTRFIGVLQRL